jgi:transcriptional regulator with XRE-family HTH domain
VVAAVRPPALISPRELRAALAVSRERMARMFDVSAKTVERWEAQDRPPSGPPTAEVFACLQEIIELGRLVYTPEGFRQLMKTPLAAFEGRTALKLLERGEAERVLAALAADYEGLGA